MRPAYVNVCDFGAEPTPHGADPTDRNRGNRNFEAFGRAVQAAGEPPCPENRGGAILIPAGEFYLEPPVGSRQVGWVISKCVRVAGAGQFASTLLIAKGCHGIELTGDSNGSFLSGFNMGAVNPTPGFPSPEKVDGIRVFRTNTHISDIKIVGFGRHGLYAYGNAVDPPDPDYYPPGSAAHNSVFINLHADGNGETGFYFRGSDCNVLRVIGCFASHNYGYGFHCDGCWNCIFINIHCNQNSAGAMRAKGGTSNTVMSMYVESEGSPKQDFVFEQTKNWIVNVPRGNGPIFKFVTPDDERQNVVWCGPRQISDNLALTSVSLPIGHPVRNFSVDATGQPQVFAENGQVCINPDTKSLQWYINGRWYTYGAQECPPPPRANSEEFPLP